MNKKEAAQFLGVSIRSLERLAASGRLTKGRAYRKTRPCVVFEQKELERLKSELEASNSLPAKREAKTLTKSSGHVGFRLDDYYVEALVRAGKASGMSPGEYARRLVIGALESNQDGQMLSELKAIRSSLAVLERSLLGDGVNA